MLATKRLEETTTHELVACAQERGVIQRRENGIYYGGCTHVANNLEMLVEVLDDDPDFLEQLHLASQPLGNQQEEGSSLPEAQWEHEDIQGATLGQFFPDLDEMEPSEESVDAPEEDEPVPAASVIDDDLVFFLASPEGAEIRKGLEADAEAVCTAARKEILDAEQLPTLEDFNQEHKQPLLVEIQQMAARRDRLRAEAGQFESVQQQMQDHLQKAKGHHHLEAAFRRQIAAMVDPRAELQEVETACEALHDKIAACQAKEAALQESWEQINTRVVANTSSHPTLQLLAAVNHALADRRAADLTRLLGQIGKQSNQTILKQVKQSDLGAEGIKVINTALSSRKWVKAITPTARKIAAAVASSKEFAGHQLPDRAQTVILRAENILILDKQNKEVGRIKVWPDGNGRWSRGQRGRPWKVRAGGDIWQLSPMDPSPVGGRYSGGFRGLGTRDNTVKIKPQATTG